MPCWSRDSFWMNSKLVWVCQQSLVKLAECNRIQLLLVPRHMGTDGNKITDHLAREGSLHPLIGPQPALGIPAEVSRQAIRDWTSKKHKGP